MAGLAPPYPFRTFGGPPALQLWLATCFEFPTIQFHKADPDASSDDEEWPSGPERIRKQVGLRTRNR